MTRAYRSLALGLAFVPGALLLGALAARAILRAAPAAISVDLAQPIPVVTNWLGFGAGMWGVLALATIAATWGSLAAVHRLRDPDIDVRAGRWMVAVSAVLALAAALSWPVIFSSDVYAYAAYGDEAARGIDPYAPLPPHASDPFLSAAAWQWGGVFPICVYGAGFVSFARSVVAVTHGLDVRATLFAFRLASSVAFLAACASLWALLARRGPPSRTQNAVVAALALNPVALWTAAEGHNDALMLAIALAGAALAVRLPVTGGVLMGLSSLVKLPGIAIGLAVALCEALEGGGARRRIWSVVVPGTLIVAVFGLPHVLGVARGFSSHARYAPQFSLQAIGAAAASAVVAPPLGASIGIALALLACAAVAFRGVTRTFAGDSVGIAWIAIALWLALPNPYPWYALWVLPVAALALDRTPFAALWGVTIFVVVRYLPDAFGSLSLDQKLVIAVTALLPLLLTLRGARALRSAEEPART